MNSPTSSVTFSLLGKLGRLGNQFFQVAATIGIARKNGCPFFLPRWPAVSFLAPTDLAFSELVAGPRPYVEPSFAHRDVVVEGATDLRGFFQSERYFVGHETEIRKLFRPSSAVTDRIETKYGPLARKSGTCSLHIRRGDYLSLPHFADLWREGYYDRAMGLFPPGTTYLVFSDDIPWCRAHLAGSQFVFVEGQDAPEDLFLMSLCESHIIANSSFSWWGAWLNPRPNKTVVAPKSWFAGPLVDAGNPFQPATYHSGGHVRSWAWGFHDTSDLIPADWRRI